MSRTLPTEEGIGYLLNRASRGLVARLRDQLRTLGLDHDMWMMIQRIRRSGGQGTSAVEAAEYLRAPVGAMTDAANRLVRDGLLRPAPGEPQEGGRLVLTEKAAKVAAGFDNEVHWMMEGATSGFTHEELDALADYLKRIIDNLA